MFKRIISILLVTSMFFCFSGFSSSKKQEIDLSTPSAKIAQSVLEYPATNEDFRYDVYTYYVAITECLSTKSNIVIPDTIQNLPVYKVAPNTFENQTAVTSVTMTNNIIEIGDRAFRNCTNLESINISKNLEICGKDAFAGCSNLKSVVVPGALITLPSGMFANCERLSAVIIEESEVKPVSEDEKEAAQAAPAARTIIGNAFSNCPMLKNVWIPSDVTVIEDSAFNKSVDYLTIYGQAQSAAAHYASKFLVDFVVLGKNEFQNILNSSIALDNKVIGEIGESSTWKITFEQICSLKNSFSYTTSFTTQDNVLNNNNELLVFCFSLKNLAASKQTINMLDIKIKVDGYMRKISTFGKINVSQLANYPTPIVGVVEPEQTLYGYVAVEVPAAWKDASIQFTNDTMLETYNFTVKSTDSKIMYIGTADMPSEVVPEVTPENPVAPDTVVSEGTTQPTANPEQPASTETTVPVTETVITETTTAVTN